MISEETGEKGTKRAEDSTDRASEKPGSEIPDCCRRMMSQMMGGSFCGPADGRQEETENNSGDFPGGLGRFMLRMMKACCGAPAEKQPPTV